MHDFQSFVQPVAEWRKQVGTLNGWHFLDTLDELVSFDGLVVVGGGQVSI